MKKSDTDANHRILRAWIQEDPLVLAEAVCDAPPNVAHLYPGVFARLLDYPFCNHSNVSKSFALVLDKYPLLVHYYKDENILSKSLSGGNKDIFTRLIAQDILLAGDDGEAALSMAARYFYNQSALEIVDLLFQKPLSSYHIDHALCVATQHDNKTFVQALLNRGAGFSIVYDEGSIRGNALALAAGSQNTKLFKVLFSHPQATKALHEGRETSPPCTALHNAARRGSQEIINTLLDNGAILNPPFIASPLHLACEELHVGNIKYLIEKGADVFAKDDQDKTVLHYVLKGFAFTIDNEYGKWENEDQFKEYETRVAETLEMLLSYGIDSKAKDFNGRTVKDMLTPYHAPQVEQILWRAELSKALPKKNISRKTLKV